MRLKRLELFGFKSFADRTVFEFGDQTLTGVVGPNGCGKSNVVDSVRWVLGEQRPTSMRGSEMTDVIFKGSTSRAALSVAEVSLILDNGSARLENRGAEVSITRRVFASGEGEYLIDGDPVRLKDVREMLFDTGLGSRGYSVLEQGRIDAVLSANPLERRRIFEEAAGISRYRQRKVEAELRLSKVADDMARLDDLLGELSTRVRSLKIQAGKAERFVAAREEWAREKARLFRHELWIAGRDLAALTGTLVAIEEKLAGAKGERAR
ncbi:MAG: AAA family ATPase, partial [Planctomycetota bacterium]